MGIPMDVFAVTGLAMDLVFLFKNSERTTNALQYPSLNRIKRQSNWKIKYYQFLNYFRLLAIALFILALARPRWVLKEEKLMQKALRFFLLWIYPPVC